MARLGLYTVLGIVLITLCASAPSPQKQPTEEITSKVVEDDDDDNTFPDDDISVESTWPSWLEFITKYDRDLLNPRYTSHSIKKRYIENGDGGMSGYLPGYGVLDQWPEYGPGSYGYIDDDRYPVDKRQASRWKYIYRKLYDLDRNSKRSPLRWKLIYQKLNDMDNGASKRGAGRLRDLNWMLNRENEQQGLAGHSLQKRFIGRWKNK